MAIISGNSSNGTPLSSNSVPSGQNGNPGSAHSGCPQPARFGSGLSGCGDRIKVGIELDGVRVRYLQLDPRHLARPDRRIQLGRQIPELKRARRGLGSLALPTSSIC